MAMNHKLFAPNNSRWCTIISMTNINFNFQHIPTAKATAMSLTTCV